MKGPALRRDLQVLPLPGDRDCVIVDEISGRFARVRRSVWEHLRHSGSGDTGLWNQAAAAGWTVRPPDRVGRNASNPNASILNAGRAAAWSPLSIRVPIGSLDRAARWLVTRSDLVFAPRAMLFWTLAAIVGVAMLLVRWEQWSGSIPTLSAYLGSLEPLSVAGVFVVTKAVHELGHAVACRRLGSRVGVAGVWFLCFMPCPYVDVTDVWRQTDPMRRAAVMAAGMIAEGVLCVIAIWVWILAESTGVRLAAMNVVLVCGVSTFLFNANPLMRYDGYFILSDLVDSTNLREEARRAWQRILIEPVSRYPRLGGRVWALLSYHGASTVYRMILMIAIAAMLLAMADRYGAWRVTAIVMFSLAAAMVTRKIKGGWAMWKGTGKWSLVPPSRRRTMLLGLIVVVSAAILIPTPRYRHVQGRLRAAETQPVYLPAEGTIDVVDVQIGDRVVREQRLAKLSDPDLLMEIESNVGQARVMEHRSRAARLASLQSSYRDATAGHLNRRSGPSEGSPSSAPERQWEVLDAAVQAITTTQQELETRRRRLEVLSGVNGVVLPSGDESAESRQRRGNPNRLIPDVGQPSSDRAAWCRIATSNRLQVAVRIDASDQREVQVGCPVRLTVPGNANATVYRCEVVSVSPMHHGATQQGMSPHTMPSVSSQESTDEMRVADGKTHVYQALCDVPTSFDVTLDSLCWWDGAVCDVVVHLPPQALWKDVWDSLADVIF